MPILINTCDMNIATIPVIWMALTIFFDFSTSANDHNASVKNRINTSIAPKNPHSSENTEKIKLKKKKYREENKEKIKLQKKSPEKKIMYFKNNNVTKYFREYKYFYIQI